MRAAPLIGFLGLVALGACAPIQNQTHYERWDAYAEAHPEDEDADRPEAPPRDMVGTKAKAAGANRALPKAAPPPPAPPADYSSLGSETPAIGGTRTATRTRVITPEPEDEPIY